MPDRRVVIENIPGVDIPLKYWVEGPLTERRQVEVGDPSSPMDAWAEEGTYYMEEQRTGYKFIAHPDDFERRFKTP